MEIANKLIQSITEELKSVVNQDINYFNKDGYIIASTDKNRIGNYHEGAKIVLETKKELSIESDKDFIGSKQGINLPVYLNDSVVGVVGITGVKAEVEQYGKIIQKITQILLKDAFLNQEKTREKESKKRLLEELIYKDTLDLESISNWFKFLKIKENISRNLIMLSLVDKNYKKLNTAYIDEIYKFIDTKLIDGRSNISTQVGKDLIIALDITNESIDSVVLKLQKTVENKYDDILVIIGVGSEANSLNAIRDSYLKSELTLNIMKNNNRTGISYYEELDLDILFKDIDKNKSNDYLKKIFKNLSSKEIDDYYTNFIEYVEANGSLQKASENLFIHKNTLQYRLDGIYKETGYNPRNLRDMVNLYIAFKLTKYK